jgi:2-oxoglutarate ferredoxin oxidoreductase subunit alpha
MQENLGYGAMAEIPCVIVDVQRAGPSTGLPTSPAQGDYMQARWGTHGDHPVIALSPSSVLETYYLMVRAFNLSEKYRTPVIFLMDEIVGHMREGVELPNPSSLIINHRRPSFHDGANKQCYYVPEGQLVPAMKPFGRGERYNITGLAHDESGFPTNNTQVAGKLVSRLLAKVEEHADDIVRVEEYAMDDAETAVVCFGGTTRAVMSAILEARAAGKKVGMFRPITVWPFPEQQLKARLPQLKRILMAEHNHGQMLLEVQRTAGGSVPVAFLGKVDGTVITPAEILAKLQEMEV